MVDDTVARTARGLVNEFLLRLESNPLQIRANPGPETPVSPIVHDHISASQSHSAEAEELDADKSKPTVDINA